LEKEFGQEQSGLKEDVIGEIIRLKVQGFLKKSFGKILVDLMSH